MGGGGGGGGYLIEVKRVFLIILKGTLKSYQKVILCSPLKGKQFLNNKQNPG